MVFLQCNQVDKTEYPTMNASYWQNISGEASTMRLCFHASRRSLRHCLGQTRLFNCRRIVPSIFLYILECNKSMGDISETAIMLALPNISWRNLKNTSLSFPAFKTQQNIQGSNIFTASIWVFESYLTKFVLNSVLKLISRIFNFL